jgi:hypothetical protein
VDIFYFHAIYVQPWVRQLVFVCGHASGHQRSYSPERRKTNPSALAKNTWEQALWAVRCHLFDGLEQDRPDIGSEFCSMLVGGVK